MKKILTSLAITIAAMSLAPLVPARLFAQSIWLDRQHDKTIAVEVLIPNFPDDNTESSAWATFLSLRAPLSKNVNFVGELPIAHSSFEFRFLGSRISESETAVGNPYLGLEIKGEDSPIFAEVGLRVPIAPEDNVGTFGGLISDMDRVEAFMPKMLPVTVMLNLRQKTWGGVVFRLRGGPSLLINTGADQGGFDDTETFLGYSAQVGYESEPVSVIGGFTGRATLSEEDADYGERSVHQLGFAASFGLDNVRPGVHLRLPLDEDAKGLVDFVLGFHLGVRLN
jgi:hypothetical protein